MASHSQSSSLADVDYYAYSYSYSHSNSRSPSHSASSSLSYGSAAFPAPPTSSYPSSTPQEAFRPRPALAPITIPPSAAFHARPSSIPVPSPSTAKRKPLPSPTRPASTSLTEKASPRLADLSIRPHSLRDPTLRRESTHTVVPLVSPLSETSPALPHEQSQRAHLPTHIRNESANSDLRPSSSVYGDSRRSSIPIHTRYAQEHPISHAPKFSLASIDFAAGEQRASRSRSNSSTGGSHSATMNPRAKPTVTTAPPSMKLELDGVRRTLTDESLSSLDSPNASRPKSPGGRGLGGFFPWKKQQAGADSPSTAFSEHSLSPLASPHPIHRSNSMDTAVTRGLGPAPRLTPPGVIDIQRVSGMQQRADYFDNDETPLLLGTPETNAHVRELEKELTQVSTELAESIKREMELEDEIDRMRMDVPSSLGGGSSAPPSEGVARSRSSDYFSDSGTGSGIGGGAANRGDAEGKVEVLEQKLRKAEQEKAQIKIEMASRLQTELSRRRDLEVMVHKLEEQFQSKMDEDDDRGDMEERVEELESTLEDTRRLLNQERQAKASFEDLYTATKDELERHVNQHDNLRDEVVPQLKARIDGLESEAADNQALMYENSRMQQELASLKTKIHSRFGSIVEDDEGSSGGRSPLSRSGSLARNVSRRGGSVSRPNDRPEGMRPRAGSVSGVLTVEGFKEIEDQRDALHKALKLLLIRSEKQQKEHERAIKKLTSANHLPGRSTPIRGSYHKEVSFLKEEVATLRKRTEDALEQKWQYEKGLSGLKMDLDRAELETRGLRIILQEHDILGSSQRTLLGNGENGEGADEQLQQSISTAETERDQARKVAEEYRRRAEAVQDESSTELTNCAKRMDELADQLEKQVQSNIELRSRLAAAVARGEQEQRESNGKIGEMQKRLASMEDSVLAAQQHSETTLGTHEAEVRKLEEASSPALQRLRLSGVGNANKRLTPTSPLVVKSPRLGSKKLSENSLLERSKTQMLERKVKELEALLREAEEDMQDVVQKVNSSQLEVAELQTERDAAFSQMRKLQTLIVEEREKAETLMH